MTEGLSYAEIGHRLREARERHGLSLAEAARQLHIRFRYLNALEEGDPAHLPGEAYAKGYLRRYALYLSLDGDALTEAYEKAGQFPQRRFFTLPEQFNRKREPSALLVRITFGLAIFTLSCIVFAPEPPVPQAIIPLPVLKEAWEQLPPGCRDAAAPAYPPCYWSAQALYVPHFPEVYGISLADR